MPVLVLGGRMNVDVAQPGLKVKRKEKRESCDQIIHKKKDWPMRQAELMGRRENNRKPYPITLLPHHYFWNTSKFLNKVPAPATDSQHS